MHRHYPRAGDRDQFPLMDRSVTEWLRAWILAPDCQGVNSRYTILQLCVLGQVTQLLCFSASSAYKEDKECLSYMVVVQIQIVNMCTALTAVPPYVSKR